MTDTHEAVNLASRLLANGLDAEAALLRRIPELEAENAAWRKQAAQSEPAEHWHRLYLEKCQQYNDRVAQLGGVIEGLEAEAAQGAGEVENVPLAWQTTRDGLLAYVLQDDLHNRLTPRVIDIAYTAFMYGARGRNAEDGSQCDWFNDTKPAIEKAITKLRKDLFEASNAPTQPAAGADVLDAQRWQLRCETLRALFPSAPSDYELDAAINAAIAASGRQS